jgi:hypothetical protein
MKFNLSAPVLGLLALVAILFQNCSPAAFSKKPVQIVSQSSTGGSSGGGETKPPEILSCNYDGRTYTGAEGPIYTFPKSLVPYTESCVATPSVCNTLNGRFEPTPGFKTCDKSPAPPVFTGLVCLHRVGGSPKPIEYIAPGDSTASPLMERRQDIYEKYSDGSYKLKTECKDPEMWHSTKENPALNCGAKISGTSGADTGDILDPFTCCEKGRVSIGGLCETENGLGEYCFADAQCKAGLTCNKSVSPQICIPK